MKKKFVAAIAAVVALVCLTFTGCFNMEPKASETFEGSVSAQSYDTKEAAAIDCIATEISGDDYKVVMTECVTEGELTEEEIDKLNVAEEIDGNIESVEKVKIYFSEVGSSAAASGAVALAASRSTELCVTVYIIKFTPEGSTVSEYKYMIPLPETDEVLSYSYYNSVMNPENFKNCTVTVKSTATVTVSGQTQKGATTQTMYITENAVKGSVTVGNESATVYFVDTASGVKCAVEYSGGCMVVSASEVGLSVNSISELYSSSLNQAQYSLFVKTAEGFKMREEALSGVVDALLDATFKETGISGFTWTTNKASCDYKVVDGKLYKGVSEIGVTAYYSGETAVINAVSEVVYTDYGTTNVQISSQAKAALGIN